MKMGKVKRIYIIDDDEALRVAYASAFRQLGYEVAVAADGREGQELMQGGLPDAIVLDMLMPNMDGTAFLRWLRSEKDYAAVPVVIASNFEHVPDDNLDVSAAISKLEYAPAALAEKVHRIIQGA